MKRLTLAEAQEEIDARDLWLWRQKHWGHPREDREESWGANEVGDHDEDYVFDALFDVPNR